MAADRPRVTGTDTAKDVTTFSEKMSCVKMALSLTRLFDLTGTFIPKVAQTKSDMAVI